ncbi:hypothetical protein FE810_01785 [Thalassotalea litorea]|uniref:Uncharacterized protein n=1 Tax=Thalassotalea litorea TaxID=2020715 RepID=A0A5R9IQA0_9GAMM|nr:hypothetical protein [Thalassotalea litorea]TLU67704.1 hypothetical protein FE810_01785 [Thalassotalea litorea]
MTAIELIDEIRKIIRPIKTEKNDAISANALDDYLEAFRLELSYEEEEHAESQQRNLEESRQAHEINIANASAVNEINIANASAVNEINLEMFRAVMDTAMAAMKTSLVMNGAACIAILSFISSIWETPAASAISSMLLVFGIGIFCSGFGGGMSYLAQVSFQTDKYFQGGVFRVFSVSLVLFSFLTFGFGLWETTKILSSS